MTDQQTIIDAAEAIRALNRRLADRDGEEYRASPEDLAQAALSVIPEAILEEATLYALRLESLTRDAAVFAAAGGFTLTMHRGEWEERRRPTQVWITVQETLESSAPV